MNPSTHDVAVIGAGGAGTMAHLRAVLNGNRSVLFLGDAQSKRKGRAAWVMEVDNLPGLHGLDRPITRSTRSTLAWIAEQPELAEKSVTVKARVTGLERDGDDFVLSWEERGEPRSTRARHVILATGIMDVQPRIGDSIEPILPFANRGDALYCVRCDGHKTIGHSLTVIGSSDTAVHIAAMMLERYGHEEVGILTNGLPAHFGPGARQLIEAYRMPVYEDEILRVLGEPARGLEGFELASGETVATTRTIVALGIIAYNELLTGLGGEVDATGRAVVSERYESSVPGLFVVGDLVAGHKMQIYTGWDEAVDAADEIDRRLRLARRERVLAGLGSPRDS